MIQRKEQRVVEELRGVGTVMSGEEKIAEVTYYLQETQEFIIVRSQSATEHLPGIKDTRGSLSVTSGGKIPFRRDPLTLILEDGRRLDFILTHSGSAGYQITGSGGIQAPAQ